jgi:hypothetical protein
MLCWRSQLVRVLRSWCVMTSKATLPGIATIASWCGVALAIPLPTAVHEQSESMVVRRRCASLNADGAACQMAPLRDRPFCFAHDPERAADAAEARRVGGQRRRREGTIAIAYDLPGLDNVQGIRRVLDIVVTDALGLEYGIARLRVLISAATSATRLLEVADFETRLAAIEMRLAALAEGSS